MSDGKKKKDDEIFRKKKSLPQKNRSYAIKEVNENDVSSTEEVNVVRQHGYPITSTSSLIGDATRRF